MSLPSALVQRLVRSYGAARDPQVAVQAATYMRDQFDHLGITTPRRRRLDREIVAGLAEPTPDELTTIALTCWDLEEREYQYFACDYLRAHGAVAGPEFLDTARTLLTTKSWWDTVDPLATRTVGDLVRRHSELGARMDAWATDDDKWLVRTAILHQLHYGPATDTERLFGYCTGQAGHQDFFVRKAIGWALRHYARTDPSAVRHFLAENKTTLSPLSLREAAKHL
jgi:3-methyladenine DNA glycosylase AlkD